MTFVVQVLSQSSANPETGDQIAGLMRQNGVEPYAIKLMTEKGLFFVVEVSGIRPEAANILKQEMLSRGGEVAVPRGALNQSLKSCRVLIMGTQRQFNELIKKCALHQFRLPEIAGAIKTAIANYLAVPRPITIGSKKFVFGKKTYLMGILNVTPDSFSDGGKYLSESDAVFRAFQIIQEGADILDIGGESSRPGSSPVNAKEELARVLPVIKAIRKQSRIPISIDTCKSVVADAAINAGADLINDISALQSDPKLAKIAAKHKVPVVLMHMQGKPKNMQNNPSYRNLFDEINLYLSKSIAFATSCGILPDKIIVDPGIGFGKTVKHNLEIINNLNRLKSLGHPILVGLSRKAFIGSITGESVEGRIEGTAAAVAIVTLRGANILRVHDVKEMTKVLKVVDAIITQ